MYQLTAGSAQGLANYGAINAAGTSIVVPGVPNGVYYVRVVAMNAAGVSAPTADHVVQVGPAPPGAPRSLTGSAAAGGIVSLSWLPPLSGSAPTSYLLLGGHTPGASTYQIPVNGTSLGAAGIPAAVYYVRIVARERRGHECRVERSDARRAVDADDGTSSTCAQAVHKIPTSAQIARFS